MRGSNNDNAGYKYL